SRTWMPLWTQSIALALLRAQAQARRARTQTPLQNGAWTPQPSKRLQPQQEIQGSDTVGNRPTEFSAPERAAHIRFRSLTRLKGRLIRRREQRPHVLGRHLARHADRHRLDLPRDKVGFGAIEPDLEQALRDRKAAQHGGQAIRGFAAQRRREPRL